MCGHHSFVRFVGVRESVAHKRNNLALRTKLRNLNLKFQLSSIDSFRYISDQMDDILKIVGVATFFLGYSISI